MLTLILLTLGFIEEQQGSKIAERSVEDSPEAPMARNDTRITALERQLASVQAQLEEQDRVQTAALRRLTMLPPAVKGLLAVENIGAGTLTQDGQGMTYELGGDLTIAVYPYQEQFMLSSVSGVMQPRTFRFGKDKEVSPQQILEILGFAELAKRDDLRETPGYWADSMSSLVGTTPA